LRKNGLFVGLKAYDALPKDYQADPMKILLNDALEVAIPFMFWGSGTMAEWEAEFYGGGMPADKLNERWWQLVKDEQGVEPPSPRSEAFCDAATKTHINDTPAYYYNYAMATVFKYQMHDYICRNILHQDVRSANYAGRKDVGDFLKKILEKGATEDWRRVLRDATGEDIDEDADVTLAADWKYWRASTEALAALEATLRLYRDEHRALEQIPTLKMIAASPEELKSRAEELAAMIRGINGSRSLQVGVRQGSSQVGGGSLPAQDLPTYVVAVRSEAFSPNGIEKHLRENNPPIIARIESDYLIMDARTVRHFELEISIVPCCQSISARVSFATSEARKPISAMQSAMA